MTCNEKIVEISCTNKNINQDYQLRATSKRETGTGENSSKAKYPTEEISSYFQTKAK